MRLYLAYGSNLDKRAMRIRCPGARPVGKILLTNARLVFRGCADVEYSPGFKVPCGIWMVTEQDEKALDRYEGVASGFYYKETGIKIKFRGETHFPLIYLMNGRHRDGIYPPCQSYVDTIRRGYKDFGFDEAYLNEAIEHSFDEKAPDEQTRDRRVRQRRDPAKAQLVEMPEAVALRRLAQQNELDL